MNNPIEEVVEPSKKAELEEMLRNGIANISFLTVKGKESEKMATLEASFLPPPKPEVVSEDANDELKKPRKVNENVLTFWSVGDNAWRSCHIDKIQTVNALDEDQVKFLKENREANG